MAAAAARTATATANPSATASASASDGATVPRGHGPPFGTTSCLYEGPWHIHVPLGPWPRGTASSACLKVAASVADSGRRRASGAGPQSVTSVHMATEKRGVMRATPPVALRVRAVQGRAKPCARRAEGGRPVAMGVERHRDVPRSRAEAGTPARATTPMAAGRRPHPELAGPCAFDLLPQPPLRQRARRRSPRAGAGRRR